MKKQTTLIALLIIMLAQLFTLNTQAQVLKKKSSKHYTPPKAILVQLNTYPSKMKLFREKGNNELIKSLKEQTDSVTKRMVDDFNDNFTYCPYYFYIDTNANLVKEGKLDGILFDRNLNPIGKSPITDTNYRITLFGVNAPPLEKYQTNTKNDLYDASYSLGSSKPGLLLLYPDFDYVKYPEPYFTTHKIRSLKRPFQSYVFVSKQFDDVVYRPYAKALSNTFSTFYQK